MKRYIQTIIERGNTDQLKELYEYNSNCYNPSDALIIAAKRGHLEMVQYLVENHEVNFDHVLFINSECNDEYLLDNAVTSGNKELVSYLLSQSKQCTLGRCEAIQTAHRNYDLDMIKMLHEHFSYPLDQLNDILSSYNSYVYDRTDDPLILPALRKACDAIIRYLINAGADINAIMFEHVPGSYAVNIAIKKDNIMMMQLLLRNGAVISDEFLQERLRSPSNRCDALLLKFSQQEENQEELYSQMLSELDAQPPRNGFPGGAEYRAARGRVVEQGMTDIAVALKSHDLSEVFAKLNITKKFTTEEDMTRFAREYLTML